MAPINRMRTAWTGVAGLPGVTTMYCLDTDAYIEELSTFWNNIKGHIPNAITLTIEPAGDIIEESTGVLTGAWTHDALDGTVGTSSEDFNETTGLVVNWLTDDVAGGRRVRGKTYLVPMDISIYDVGGHLDTGIVAGVQAHCDEHVTAAADNFVIWHRPGGSTPGSYHAVTSAHVSAASAYLKSRRT